MALSWSPKDPDEVLDYMIDWSPRLVSGDAITTSTWIVPDGLTKDSDSNTDTSTTIWLSGGTRNTSCIITNEIVTTGGRTMDQTVTLKIRDK